MDDRPNQVANEFDADLTRSAGERAGTLLALLLVIAIPVLGIWALIDMFPGEVPETKDPGYIDVIFQNRFVVFAARLVVLSAAFVLMLGAIYVASSMIVRIKRGQWLRRAGPFESELAEAQETLGEDVNSLLESLDQAWESNQELEQRLEERDRQLAEAYRVVEALGEEVERLQRAKGA